MKPVLLIPLVLFLGLALFLLIGLFRDPREVPSPLINKPAPEFQLAQLQAQEKTISTKEMRGKVWLLNAWGITVTTSSVASGHDRAVDSTLAVPR